MLVMDEADILLSFGYEDDIKLLAPALPLSCQCLLMSATSSTDVEKLKKLLLHNPVTLTLEDIEGGKDSLPSGLSKSVQQYVVRCSKKDKLLYILGLLRFQLIIPKTLIFVNSINDAFKVKLFLENFGIKCALLNSELPQNSRLHILQQFNKGLFEHLIATDEGAKRTLEKKETAESKKKLAKKKEKVIENKEDQEGGEVENEEEAEQDNDSKTNVNDDEKKKKRKVREFDERGESEANENSIKEEREEDEEGEKDEEEETEKIRGNKKRKNNRNEFGVIRGIDFKFVRTVINYDLPIHAVDYIHRVGRTGRAGKAGLAISLVSTAEESTLVEIENALASKNTNQNESSQTLTSHPVDENQGEDDSGNKIESYPLITTESVEAIRYRAEDVIRSLTKAVIKEARAKELRLEMLNSERLKTHFEENPLDYQLLKHDKNLSKNAPAPHLKILPSYLRDPKVEIARQKLMGSESAAAAAKEAASAHALYIKRKKTQKRNSSSSSKNNPLRTFTAFHKTPKGQMENPEVAAALSGTKWAKQQEKKMKKKKK